VKVREMVRQTNILKEIPPEEFVEHENLRKKKRKNDFVPKNFYSIP
jgi:hypothetical protein